MINSTVTCIVNGKTYRLCADDTKEMGNMSSVDRQQLIDLLEVLKQQSPIEPVVARVAQQDVAPKNTVQKNTGKERVSKENPLASMQPPGERKPQSTNLEHLANGDVNAFAARLLEEEKSKQKTPITKGAIYKWIGGLTVIAILLILVL